MKQPQLLSTNFYHATEVVLSLRTLLPNYNIQHNLIFSKEKRLKNCLSELYLRRFEMMKFNPMKWKTRTVMYAGLAVLVLYVLFLYKKPHVVMTEVTINNSNPHHVWEFVADFSNMKTLNPTIEDFNVIAESGTYEHWKYSVEYIEHFSHIPIIRNVAHAHYAVTQDKNGFLISSRHHTCFIFNLVCLESVSQFRFDKDGNDHTKCIETVQYQCPIAFSILCYKEVTYQRQAIMNGLKSRFSETKTKTN